MLLLASIAIRELSGTTIHRPNSDENETTNVPGARIFACVMSTLSICGALLIILSYLCFKNIRTKAREVLLHLSMADFGVGSTNLIGGIINYGSLIQTCHNHTHHNLSYPLSCVSLVDLCKVQAFFAEFFMLASILWTLLLAFYVYTLVLDPSRKLSLWIVRFGYLVCWGMPLLVSVWLVSTKKLGKTKIGGAGWCSLRAENRKGNVNHVTVFFGNDLWVMSTFFLIFILYTTLHCHLRGKLKEMKKYNAENFSHYSDAKFLAIPFFFLLLRAGSIVVSILFVYTDLSLEIGGKARSIILYWMFLGDSSEGLVNGVIFCLLTPRIRHKFFSLFCCCCCKLRESSPLLHPPRETYEQRRLLENPEVSAVPKYSVNRNMSSSVSSSTTSDSDEY